MLGAGFAIFHMKTHPGWDYEIPEDMVQYILESRIFEDFLPDAWKGGIWS